MDQDLFFLICAAIGVAYFIKLLSTPALPLPRWKQQRTFSRLARKNVYHPREGVPTVMWSKWKTKRIQHLNERVKAENVYLENLRQQERLKARRKGY